ncbi:hypothetical protein MIND_00124600 [Mycena indigotica]|uniref:Protein kinase domain-containing protein n=1 Tax=Mycena indigotica TaxID=2126181 RepID=A0A8H6WGN8_9AGAR|nr:uncharacterized protein MIND_00124600 [Mycena indigotica]KAF7316066.1 hypothetical protein MIND_00124600 [Mycena indigotica]
MMSILDQPISASPNQSDDSDESDATLDDIEILQGHPLQRVPARRDSDSGESSTSANSDVIYDIDFDQLIDDLLAEEPFPLSETRNTVAVEASSPEANDSMLIKRLHRTSPELLILLRLNQRELRHDPWNPTPHIICAIPRDEYVFICLQRLLEFNKPPLHNVANYVDFFRQVLEGLTFLHEHNIALLGCRELGSYMVDLGPETASGSSASVESFDRTRYPVRYYFADLPNACEFESSSHSDAQDAFRQDVQDCALMMRHLAANVPTISQKLSTLVNAMQTGTFDADASRKLFEALCKSFTSSTFEIVVPPMDFDEQVVILPPIISQRAGLGSPGLPVAASVPDLRLEVQVDDGLPNHNGRKLMRTISLSRKLKLKSNTLDPIASPLLGSAASSSPSSSPRTRARSAEPPTVESRLSSGLGRLTIEDGEELEEVE